MRISLSKRADLEHDVNNKMVTELKYYGKPTGAACTVYVAGSASHIVNGSYHDVNDPLSKHLTDLGVNGHVVIHHKKTTRGVSRWLNYSMTNHKFEDWKDEIIVYTFDQKTYRSDLIDIRPLQIYESDYDKLGVLNDELSRGNPMFDGILVEGKLVDGATKYYHFVPTRYVKGKIVGLCGTEDGPLKGFVVEVFFDGFSQPVRVNKLPPWLIDRSAETKKQYLDKECYLQYTSYTPGSRLCNFSSVIVYQIEGVKI